MHSDRGGVQPEKARVIDTSGGAFAVAAEQVTWSRPERGGVGGPAAARSGLFRSSKRRQATLSKRPIFAPMAGLPKIIFSSVVTRCFDPRGALGIIVPTTKRSDDLLQYPVEVRNRAAEIFRMTCSKRARLQLGEQGVS
jgi:hypothetical protein